MFREEEEKTEVIGVRFQHSGVTTYVHPREETFEKEQGVIVSTDRGVEYAVVNLENIHLPITLLPENMPKLLRRANDEDETILLENQDLATEAAEIAEEKIAAHELDMKLVGCEYTFDRDKLIFYFTAEERVDFRALVRDLAQTFHTRIELRQIGVRDQARMIGGLGSCGQPLCCRRFMNDFVPVSIKMAKTQGLSLNPSKISGACGRLMCCLNYEQDHYLHNTKRVPMKGTLVRTTDGQGYVVDRDVLQTRIRVHLYKPDGTEDERYYPVADVEILERRKKGETRPALRTQEELDAIPFVTEGEKHPERMEPEVFSPPASCTELPCAKAYEQTEASLPACPSGFLNESKSERFEAGIENSAATMRWETEIRKKTEIQIHKKDISATASERTIKRASAESYAQKGRVKPRRRRGRSRK